MDTVEARYRERAGCGAAGGHVVGRSHVQLQPGVQDGAAAGDDRRSVHGEPVPQLTFHRSGGMGRNSHTDGLPRVSGTGSSSRSLRDQSSISLSLSLCLSLSHIKIVFRLCTKRLESLVLTRRKPLNYCPGPI